MVRKVFIVARGYTETYEQLRRALIGEPDVDVIYDRREYDGRDLKQKKPGRSASIWSRGPLVEVGDRRTPSHVDADLRTRGWAVARVDDELEAGPADAGAEDRPDTGSPGQ